MISSASDSSVKPQVLVVDDDVNTCSFLERYLTMLGCQTLSVLSGEAALESVQQTCPDLVLLDLMLPGLDGIQVLRQLQEKHAGIKVIMMSGIHDMQKAQMTLSYGALDFIAKPVEISMLRKIVQTHLRLTR